MAYVWSPRKLCQILSLSLLHVSFTFFRLVLQMLRERTDGLYIVRGKVSVRKIDESEDDSEDIIEFTDVSDEEHDIDSDEEEYSGVSEVDYEDIVDEGDGDNSELNESEDSEETDFEDNEDEEEDIGDFCDLLFLQNIRSSDISIWENVTIYSYASHMSETDLTELESWLTSQDGEDSNHKSCRCPICKQYRGEMRYQCLPVKAVYLTLHWVHVLLRPVLYMAGWSSQESYVVRRSWREDSSTEVLIQNTKTGVLIGARRLGTMVRPGENFLSRLENFLSSEESDSGEFLCPGLSCKVRRALRFAGGEMASQVNLSEFDVDTVTVSPVSKTEISWCPVCLAPLETGQDAVVLRCGHNFHNNCVGHWLGEGNLSCPVCRAAVKEKEPPSLYWTL